jgi:hypothetical protein
VSHDQPGQGNPSGGRDEFDHFFSDRNQPAASQDPDTTAWADPANADADRTQATEHAPYVRPPQQYDEYGPADQSGYYEPAPYREEPPQRRGAMWAPVAVIVASLAIVAIVIALILNNSTGKMAQGAFTPTQTVTKTTTQQSSPSPSSSSPSSSSASSSSSSSSTSSSSSSSPSSSSSSPASQLPASAGSCPGTSSYGTGPKTSCGFAGVVATLYNAKKQSDGSASFTAKSPETHKNYQVSCQAGSYVTCTTETGAIIYVVRA